MNTNHRCLWRGNQRALTALIVLYACIRFAAQADEPAKKPFTVLDTIEMTRVLDLEGYYSANAVGATALFSPDRSHFVIRMKRGDLGRNVNVESLLIFNTTDVETYLKSQNGGERPSPKFLAQVDIAVDWSEMSGIQWLNDSEVGFITQGDNGRKQVFAAKGEGGRASQLTHSQTSVASFAVSGDRILYYAHVETEAPLVTALGDRRIYEMLFWGADPTNSPIQLFQSSRFAGSVQRLDVPAVRLGPGLKKIWFSPSGDYAVTLAPAVNAPAHWADYKVINYENWGYRPDRVSSDPTSWDLAVRPRYQLVNLNKNTAQPLLDAPSGFVAFNRTPKEVFWPRDGHSVIVSNTYVPLGVRELTLRGQRKAGPAIAEIDLRTGAVNTILWEPMLTEEQMRAGQRLEPIVSIDWDGKSKILTVTKRSAQGQIVHERHQKSGDTWRRVQTTEQSAIATLAIQRREGLNERPKVYATGGVCACTKLLFDPNPQADQFTFGRAEILKWTDKNSIEWQGGLILPPHYLAERRYPLVVQTHGFQPDEFLVDGPSGSTTAFAAQALANAGMVVLQIPDHVQATTQDERQASLYAEGYRAAIDNLVALGIADPTKVGLIAFSATGYHTIRLLADEPNLLAAASISDSVQPGYLQDVLQVNNASVEYIRKLNGGMPSEIGYGEWFARNPLYKLSHISAAVRIEAMGPGSAIAMLETYAVLRNARRPVDLIYFPEGSHVLMKPAERLGSQGGNVDWFRFWLQGYEDPDAAKAEQYRRWRKMQSDWKATRESEH